MKAMLLTAFAAIGLTATSSQAATYLMDFGGSGSNPTTGGTWNIIKAPAGTSGDTLINGTFTLSDSSGSAAANIQIQFTDDMIDNHGTQSTTNLTPQTSPLTGGGVWVDNAVLADYLILATSASNTTGRFVFNNLPGAQKYSLEIVGSRETTGTGRDALLAANGLAPDNFPTGFMSQERNKTIAAWAELTPVSGTIAVDVSIPTGSTFSYVNAIRLNEVPEPTSLVLFGVTAVIALRRRHK